MAIAILIPFIWLGQNVVQPWLRQFFDPVVLGDHGLALSTATTVVMISMIFGVIALFFILRWRLRVRSQKKKEQELQKEKEKRSLHWEDPFK